jgi:hypothetical protein
LGSYCTVLIDLECALDVKTLAISSVIGQLGLENIHISLFVYLYDGDKYEMDTQGMTPFRRAELDELANNHGLARRPGSIGPILSGEVTTAAWKSRGLLDCWSGSKSYRWKRGQPKTCHLPPGRFSFVQREATAITLQVVFVAAVGLSTFQLSNANKRDTVR